AERKRAKPVGSCEKIADQLVSPKAKRERNQDTHCAKENRGQLRSATRYWRRRGGESLIRRSEHVNFGRGDHNLIRSQGAGRTYLLVGRRHTRGFTLWRGSERGGFSRFTHSR